MKDWQTYVGTLQVRSNSITDQQLLLSYPSAGVGRTGTFIAIDSEIQHIRHENIVDLYNCVLRLRYWRNFMVQSSVRHNH